MAKKTEEESIFDESNRAARDLAGENWFKFAAVGDKVGGVIKDMFEKPVSPEGYPAQRCFTLQQEDGEYINVGLKRTSYILSRTDMLQIGDSMGIKFEKEIPSTKKGFHPAKSMVIFSKLVGDRTNAQAKDLVPAEVKEEEDKEFDLG